MLIVWLGLLVGWSGAHYGCDDTTPIDPGLGHLVAEYGTPLVVPLSTGYTNRSRGPCTFIVTIVNDIWGITSIASDNNSWWTLTIFANDPNLVLPNAANPTGKYTF